MHPTTQSYDEPPRSSPDSAKRDESPHAYTNTMMHQEISSIITEPIKSQSKEFSKPSSKSSSPLPPSLTPPQDIIGYIIGDFGVWQLRTVLIIFLCKIPAAWFMACIIFTAPELYPQTEFECDASILNENQTITQDQCEVISQVGDAVNTERCPSFIYNSKFDSLIMQFDLVCFREIFIAWTQYWHLFGVLVGGFVGTKMMLWISPRNTYFTGMCAQILCGVVTGYARDFSLHCAFRCLSAVCCAIMFTSGQAIFVDLTAGVYRFGSIILYDTFWSVGLFLLPELSSWFHSWTHIYLGITFPTLFLMLLLQWTPESPRWLLKNGSIDDIDRVEATIREGAAINDRTERIPSNFRFQLENLREKLINAPPPAPWRELWRGHYRAKTHMIAAHLALSAFIINFMGMLLNMRSFGRDYLNTNTILMGLSEAIGCFTALHFLLKHNKWKWQYAGVFNIIAGLIGCLGWTFSRNETMHPLVKVTIWMIIATIPKAGVSCAQSMIFACLNELMPPNKKVPFVFSVITFSRVWLLSAPFFNVLKKFDVALSLCSYSILSIIGGICTCFLLTPRTPETKRNLPELTNLKGANTDKEQSPLRSTVWTVDDEVHNTKL